MKNRSTEKQEGDENMDVRILYAKLQTSHGRREELSEIKETNLRDKRT